MTVDINNFHPTEVTSQDARLSTGQGELVNTTKTRKGRKDKAKNKRKSSNYSYNIRDMEQRTR